MKFIRYGGLSPVDYKNPEQTTRVVLSQGEYYNPPVRKGIYAFIAPYEDSFLWVWKIKDKSEYELPENMPIEECIKHWDAMDAAHKRTISKYRRQLKRVFQYDGLIWTHLPSEGVPNVRSWYRVHTSKLQELLRKCKHGDRTTLVKDAIRRDFPKDPYLRGLNGAMSIDHLEVFIEKRFLARIR